jgi:hypothetical protein
MQTKSAVVFRGVVEAPTPSALAEQRRVNLLSSGFGARTHAHTRRFQPGDTITADDIRAAELERLVALGVCRWVESP